MKTGAVVSLVVTLVVASFAVLPLARTTPPAQACSIGVPSFEDYRLASDFAALVDVESVGGPENSYPTVTPWPTFTPTESPTRAPGTATPEQSPTSTFPPIARDPVDLTGYGATARIIKPYRGPRGTVRLDQQARLNVERAVRVQESLPPNVISPCPPNIGAVRWTPGARYIVFAQGSGSSFESLLGGRFRVIGDDIVFQDPSIPQEDFSYLSVTESVYNLYLNGVEAERFDNAPGEEAWYIIRAERMPLALFEPLLIEGRTPMIFTPPIVPPRTGNAGLHR
jgi:hypothetical protein